MGAHSAGGAVAVKHDFMLSHAKTVRCERTDAFYAACKVEQLPAPLAEEEMMMLARGSFIMRRYAGNHDDADLALRNELAQSTVHGSNAQGGYLAPSLAANLSSC